VPSAALFTASAVFASVALTAAPAMAGASARLVYVRAAGAERCPGEDAVRAAVSARLGYDPFFAWAHDTLVAEIARTGGAYRVTIRLVDDASHLRGARQIQIREADCDRAVAAMGLTISLTIDPDSLTRGARADASPQAAADGPPSPPTESTPSASTDSAPRAGPAPSPPSVPAPSPPITSSPSPVTSSDSATSGTRGADDRLRPEVALGFIGTLGAEPGPSAGMTLSIGSVWRALSLDIEGRADLPQTHDTVQQPAQVRSWLVAGSLVPCARFRFVFGCPVFSAGWLEASGVRFDGARTAHDVWMGAGARAGAELRLPRDVALRVHVEALGMLRRESLTLGSTVAYTYPPVAGAAGLGVRWTIR
jgi:hypothetical protein